MKIAFITDVHAYAFNDFSRSIKCRWNFDSQRYAESEDGELVLNSRLFNILSALCDTRDYCKNHNIKVLINGGDTFHKRNTLDVTTFNCVYRVLETFKDCFDTHIIISGNHDNAINADNSPSSVEVFKNFASVVTSPVTIPVFDSGDETKICCVPWTKDKKKSIEFIQENVSKQSILVAHLGVSGASLGSGYVMSDDYSLGELKVDKWKYVLLGHFHQPQVLHENTIYGGSLLQNDFGDEGTPHGFWIIDTSKRYDMEFISLDYPQFTTITSDNLDDYSEEYINNNYVRVQTTSKDVDKVQDKLKDVSDVRVEIEKEYSKNTRSDISVTMSHEEVIRTYVDEAAKQSELMTEPLINKGLEVIRKVGV